MINPFYDQNFTFWWQVPTNGFVLSPVKRIFCAPEVFIIGKALFCWLPLYTLDNIGNINKHKCSAHLFWSIEDWRRDECRLSKDREGMSKLLSAYQAPLNKETVLYINVILKHCNVRWLSLTQCRNSLVFHFGLNLLSFGMLSLGWAWQ